MLLTIFVLAQAIQATPVPSPSPAPLPIASPAQPTPTPQPTAPLASPRPAASPTPAASPPPPKPHAELWTLLLVSEGPDEAFQKEVDLSGTPTFEMWDHNYLKFRISVPAAAQLQVASECKDVTFGIELYEERGLITKAGTAMDVNKPPLLKGSVAYGKEGPLEMELGTRDLQGGLFKVQIKASSESCAFTESRQFWLRRHGWRVRRYQPLDSLILFEHAQSDRLRPGFATIVTWGPHTGPNPVSKPRGFQWVWKPWTVCLVQLLSKLSFGLGLHTAIIDFDPKDNRPVELGIGASATLFQGALSVGYGKNFSTDFRNQNYFFVGTSVTEIVQRAKNAFGGGDSSKK
jgi:hypothetical protein